MKHRSSQHYDSAYRIAKHFENLELNTINPPLSRGYSHMGATICDTILQAGLNYRNVVAPRINNLLEKWPDATTTSVFLNKMKSENFPQVIRWKHAEKLTRIEHFTNFLESNELETESQIAIWLNRPGFDKILGYLRGFGPKTIDYLRMLVGLPAVPIDRHVREFAKNAGSSATTYDELQDELEDAALILNLSQSHFDYAIWRFMSDSKAKGADVKTLS